MQEASTYLSIMAERHITAGHTGHLTAHVNTLHSCVTHRSRRPEQFDCQVLEAFNDFVDNDHVHLKVAADPGNIFINCDSLEEECRGNEESPQTSRDDIGRASPVLCGDACCVCASAQWNTKPVIFYERLELPLVFTLKTEERHNSVSDTSESSSWTTDMETEDGLLTPPSEYSGFDEPDGYAFEVIAHSDALMACTYRTEPPRGNELHAHSSPISCSMDSNHNNTKIVSTEAFPFPIQSDPYIQDDLTPTSLSSSGSPMRRLTTVRESVSELDETDDCLDQSRLSDDPFVRRNDSFHGIPHINLILSPPPCENEHSSPSFDFPTSDSPLLQRRSRMCATSGDASPNTLSPSLGRRGLQRHSKGLDIEEVKELTSRLNLQTRRPSVHAWKQQHLIGGLPKFSVSQDVTRDSTNESGIRWSHDFRDKINTSLDWLRTELTSMREQDAILARQLLNIRKGMYKLKLQKSTLGHQLILDEAMEREEERDELHRNKDCDLTPDLFSPTLKQVGVTRMNLNCRRFSVF